MEIVIKIDENVFTRLFDNGTEDYAIANDDLFALAKSIRKGTPLPKGHGDLVDRDELLIESEWYGERSTYSNPMPKGEIAVPEKAVLNAPTIIEADKESKE